MLRYHKLQDRPRDFLAATGLLLNELQQWLPAWQRAYEQRYPSERTRAGKPRQRRPGAGAKGVLHRFEDKLVCIVLYPKTHPWHTRHAWQCGLRQPHAPDWLPQWLPVLQAPWAASACAPARAARRLATRPRLCAGAPAGALAGTERHRHRPTEAQRQQEHDSGQTKTPTEQPRLWGNERTRQGVSLGPTVAGKTPDKNAADEAEMPSPIHAPLDKDTGLQG